MSNIEESGFGFDGQFDGGPDPVRGDGWNGWPEGDNGSTVDNSPALKAGTTKALKKGTGLGGWGKISGAVASGAIAKGNDKAAKPSKPRSSSSSSGGTKMLQLADSGMVEVVKKVQNLPLVKNPGQVWSHETHFFYPFMLTKQGAADLGVPYTGTAEQMNRFFFCPII